MSLADPATKVREAMGGEIKMREQRDIETGGFEDDEIRKAWVTTHAALEEYESRIRDAEASKQFTPAGLEARRRTLREDLVLRAEKYTQRKQADERADRKSQDEAWTQALAPPAGTNATVDAIQLSDMRRQLADESDIAQHEVLLRDDQVGRLARRVAFTWPLVKRLGLPDTEQQVRKRVLEAADVGALHFRALEWGGLAAWIHRAVGIDEAPRILGRDGA
jgi:hypothetical protein